MESIPGLYYLIPSQYEQISTQELNIKCCNKLRLT